jgi:hypothetical protein
LQPLSELAKLKCKYVHHGSAWLRLAPFKMEVNSIDPFNVVFKDMLYDHVSDKFFLLS